MVPGKSARKISPMIQTITMRTKRYLSLTAGGGRAQWAMVAEGRWSIARKSGLPLLHERNERWVARAVVLDDGRLLHATVVGNRKHWWSNRPDESNKKAFYTTWELRLVAACDDGIVLRAFLP